MLRGRGTLQGESEWGLGGELQQPAAAQQHATAERCPCLVSELQGLGREAQVGGGPEPIQLGELGELAQTIQACPNASHATITIVAISLIHCASNAPVSVLSLGCNRRVEISCISMCPHAHAVDTIA